MSTNIRAIWPDTEWLTDWDSENCDQCVKEGPNCPLWLAITEAAYGESAGSLPDEIVARLGWRPPAPDMPDWSVTLTWTCAERQRETDPPAAAHEMRKAGAAELPLFGGG